MCSEREALCAAGHANVMSERLQVPLGQLASQDGQPHAADRKSFVLPDGEIFLLCLPSAAQTLECPAVALALLA